ncbi:TraR/DksA C4-type zinc finger protein [Streptomyces sp. NPDC003077]|uniref:TraR/DksA family transcriptional regulator n=1 Tax=Streptomyces sp. NPDC003077 TaxID=3154443 RepID=UPI0033AC39C5
MVAKKSAAERSTTPGKKPAAKQTAGDEAAGKGAAGKRAAARPAEPDGAAVERAAPGQAELDAAAGQTAAAAPAPAKKAVPAEGAVPANRTGAKTVVAKETQGGTPAAAPEERDGPDRADEHGAAGTPAGGGAGSDGGPASGGRSDRAAADELAVRPGEDPWTPEEVAEARTGLEDEVRRLREEIAAAEDALARLMQDSSDVAGDDEADTGTKNITREHEMSLAANAREMLLQTERALERLDAGTYGLCENCGKPIGKARMQAFPRATLCVECKQKQERRG